MAVVIETTLGDITVDLYLEQRPATCLNFLKLCKMKYYNFNLFHTIQSGFIAQTGDPSGEGSNGESIWGLTEGSHKRLFSGEKRPKIRHTSPGLLSMVCSDEMMVGSQFFFTLAPDLDSLDDIHCVIGEVTEGFEVIQKLNEVICDEKHRPYRDVRITHTVVLEDPFNDPPKLVEPSRSPSPSAERLKNGRIAPDEEIDETKGKSVEEIQEQIADKEAKARATILEIVGDLPDADIAPPENVLFVCKLNPVTTDEDLEIIFSRFGKIVSCEVIRDKKSGDSLQYAFIEFDNKKSCEDAYFKMDNVLIDDRRIHVDFSQSVSKIKWLGKGRGVKHINDDEDRPKNKNGNNYERSSNKKHNSNNDEYHRKRVRHRNSDEELLDFRKNRSRNNNERHDENDSRISKRRHSRDRYERKHESDSDEDSRSNSKKSKSNKDKYQSKDRDYDHKRRELMDPRESREKYKKTRSKPDEASDSENDKETTKKSSRITKKRSEDKNSSQDTHRYNDKYSSSRDKSNKNSSSRQKDSLEEKNKYKRNYNSDNSDVDHSYTKKEKKVDIGTKHSDIRKQAITSHRSRSRSPPTSDFYKSNKHENSSRRTQSKSSREKSTDRSENHDILKSGDKYSNSEQCKGEELNEKTDSKKKRSQSNNDKSNIDDEIKSKSKKKLEVKTKSSKSNEKNIKKKNIRKKKKRLSTSSDTDSSESSSSSSSSSSESDRKKKSVKRKKRKQSTSSSSSSSSSDSSESSSSSGSSSDSSSSSSESDSKKKKTKKIKKKSVKKPKK